MKKTDKKIDHKIRMALTQVCDIALNCVDGFQWLTHQVNYARWPQSLLITCVFSCNKQLDAALTNHQDDFLRSLIAEKLAAVAVPVNNLRQQIHFDSEENCDRENQGQWQNRLRSNS